MRTNNKPIRKKFFLTQIWLSLCSRHIHDDECDICKIGNWHYKFAIDFSEMVSRISPKFWIYWINLPWRKDSIKKLEKFQK